MVRNKSLLMTAAVLLASSCCPVEGFSTGTSATAAHQRLMRPAIENASENCHHRHNPSPPLHVSPTALQMVGSIRKQPANYPGGSAGGGRRSEQIARRHQELRSAAERGDRRARPNPQNRRPDGATSRRKQQPLSAAATAEAPSALNDAFRMRSGSHFEILMPDDITLSSSTSSSSSSSKSTEEASLPTPDQLENAEAASRKSLVDAKIAALLAADDEEDDEDDGGDGGNGDGDIADDDLADRETVYTRLSDAAKSQATAAISKSNSYGAASSSGDGGGAAAPSLVASSTATAGSRHRVISKKKRVTAQVQETGRDTIRQSYTKSFTNHELLSRESEAALGREIQILARWEERRQELEVQLMR